MSTTKASRAPSGRSSPGRSPSADSSALSRLGNGSVPADSAGVITLGVSLLRRMSPTGVPGARFKMGACPRANGESGCGCVLSLELSDGIDSLLSSIGTSCACTGACSAATSSGAMEGL